MIRKNNNEKTKQKPTNKQTNKLNKHILHNIMKSWMMLGTKPRKFFTNNLSK